MLVFSLCIADMWVQPQQRSPFPKQPDVPRSLQNHRCSILVDRYIKTFTDHATNGGSFHKTFINHATPKLNFLSPEWHMLHIKPYIPLGIPAVCGQNQGHVFLESIYFMRLKVIFV
jgi:hypothetical protein